MNTPAPRLAVRDLATHFATRAGIARAVDGVSFDVMPGEIVGLVGESGSGKSVTGYSLMGLIDPPGRIVAGSVKLDGEEVLGLSKTALNRIRGARIAMVFQDPMATLNPVLSIGAQIGLALRAHGLDDPREIEARALAALESVGIPEARRRLAGYPHQLSGGMRQRVAIAIAFINRPAFVICDEPTTALDVSIQAQILVMMRKLVRDMGVSLLWISHDLATVSMLASRLLVMYAGRIIEEGPLDIVLRAPRHPYTRGLLGSLPAQGTPGAPLVQIRGNTPSLMHLPQGCAFAPRCDFAGPACSRAPEPVAAGPVRFACHYPLAQAEPA